VKVSFILCYLEFSSAQTKLSFYSHEHKETKTLAELCESMLLTIFAKFELSLIWVYEP
jgi:hypothetical protein